MQIEMRAIGSVTPYEKNPRKNDRAVPKVAESIKAYGFRQPIVVDEAGVIIVGHTRWRAAQMLGMALVPVLVAVGLAPELVRAYRLADNRTGEIAEWDDPLLTEQLMALVEMEAPLAPIGFTEEELNRLLADPPADGLVAPDALPVSFLSQKPKPGDVWVCGRHRVACGDATVAADVLRACGGMKPWIAICEPPAGVDVAQAWRLAPVDVAYVWHQFWDAGPIAQGLRAALFDLRSQLILQGGGVRMPGGCDYSAGHLPCWYGVKRGAKARWGGNRKQSTVWSCPLPEGEPELSKALRVAVPRRRSVELYQRIMLNHGGQGDVIYLPFAGSGAGLIAAERTHRSAVVLESSTGMVDLILARWEAFTGEAAKKETGNG